MFIFGYDDPYFFLIILSLILGFYAQFKVKSTFDKYSKVNSRRGYTGAQAAERILSVNGLGSVRIERIEGTLNDHYDPRSRVLRLSAAVYDSTSLSALGVAAHEAGHAIQHANAYSPIVLRNSIFPVVRIGSFLAVPLVFIGFYLEKLELIWVGIWLFLGVVLFQLITLPVEFNASSRAISSLAQTGLLDNDETAISKKVLNAAALTYVAATITAMLQLLRFISLTRRR